MAVFLSGAVLGAKSQKKARDFTLRVDSLEEGSGNIFVKI